MENSTPQAKSQPSKVSSASRPINENHINVSFPLQQFQQDKQGEIKTIEIQHQAQPILLSIDTPTDWPVVGATVFVGIVGSIISYRIGAMASAGQKNQVLASQAAFRHEWQKDFKQLVGKFVSTSLRIKFELDSSKEYKTENKKEYNQLVCDLIECRALFEVMLDRSKSSSNDINNTAENIVQATVRGDMKVLERFLNEFIVLANNIVEKAWIDMRSDIQGGRKTWKNIFRS